MIHKVYNISQLDCTSILFQCQTCLAQKNSHFPLIALAYHVMHLVCHMYSRIKYCTVHTCFFITAARRPQLLRGRQCLCGGPRGARRRLRGRKDTFILHLLPPLLRRHCLHPVHSRHQQMFCSGESRADFFFCKGTPRRKYNRSCSSYLSTEEKNVKTRNIWWWWWLC